MSTLSQFLTSNLLSTCFFVRNSNNTTLLLSGLAQISFHMSIGGLNIRAGSDRLTLNSITISGATTGIVNGVPVKSLISLSDVQIFDCTSAAIQLLSGIMIESRSGLSGTGNVIGLLLGGTTTTSRSSDITFGWLTTTDLPNLLGTTTPIRIEGSTDINLTWAQVPFDSDAQSGIGTLVNGTVTITARNANLRPPIATHDTIAGTAIGTLTIPTATRTASQFVVNSVNAAGALADDDSTFRWQIPPMTRKIVIAQHDSLNAGV